MSRVCPVTGRRRHKANNVSHANNRSRKWQYPNLRMKRIFDESTGEWIRLKVSARGLRTITRIGLQKALKLAK
jgi:large subunit ribosomal protein L28